MGPPGGQSWWSTNIAIDVSITSCYTVIHVKSTQQSRTTSAITSSIYQYEFTFSERIWLEKKLRTKKELVSLLPESYFCKSYKTSVCRMWWATSTVWVCQFQGFTIMEQIFILWWQALCLRYPQYSSTWCTLFKAKNPCQNVVLDTCETSGAI